MAGPARDSADDSPAAPGWGDIRQKVMTELGRLRDPDGAVARDAVAVLRDLNEAVRRLVFDEAVIEADAARRAGEIMAAAGLAVPAAAARRRRLRAVR